MTFPLQVTDAMMKGSGLGAQASNAVGGGGRDSVHGARRWVRVSRVWWSCWRGGHGGLLLWWVELEDEVLDMGVIIRPLLSCGIVFSYWSLCVA